MAGVSAVSAHQRFVPESERDAFRPALAGASAPTLVKGQATENQRLDASPS